MKELNIEGKTISKIEHGEVGWNDEAMILHMTDNTIYLIESGSMHSCGILCCEEIKEYPPHNWKPK